MKTNTYVTEFKARCPVDQSLIDYRWTLVLDYVVMAEELRRIADGIGTGLHEEIANQLFDRFGGVQRLRATHAGGVEITTNRCAQPAPDEQAAGLYCEDDIAAIRMAVSLFEDVLTDIEGWEDRALSEAIEGNLPSLRAIVESDALLRAAPHPQAQRAQAEAVAWWLEVVDEDRGQTVTSLHLASDFADPRGIKWAPCVTYRPLVFGDVATPQPAPQAEAVAYPIEGAIVQCLNEARCLSKRIVGNRELAARIMKIVRATPQSAAERHHGIGIRPAGSEGDSSNG